MLTGTCAHCVEPASDLRLAHVGGGRLRRVCGRCAQAFAEGDGDYLASANDIVGQPRRAGRGAKKPSLDQLDREAS